MKKYLIIVIGLIFILSLSTLSAEATIYYPNDDAYVNRRGSSGSSYLYIGDTSNDIYRSYLKFDLSLIPLGSTVTSASFKLACQWVDSFYDSDDVNLHRVTESDWDENSITWSNQPDDSPVYVAKLLVNSSGWKTWAGLEGLVKYWVDNPSLNYGMMLECDLDSRRDELYAGFYSREFDYYPRLEIEHEEKIIPEPGTMTMILLGIGSLATGLFGIAGIRKRR